MTALEFGDAHRVVLANLAQQYEAWVESARRAAAHDFVFQIKRQSRERAGDELSQYQYLYRMTNSGKGLGNSLGRLTPALEAMMRQHEQLKTAALSEESGRLARLENLCRQYRALRIGRNVRLGAIASEAAEILRMMDVYGFLGHRYMVVGTNAMPVYEIEANARFAEGVDATEDFDMTWTSGKLDLQAGAPAPGWDAARATGLGATDELSQYLNSAPGSLRELLKRLDATYTKNTERTFQLRNRAGYEVEVLLAKSIAHEYPRSEQLSPIPLEEQDWLLLGQQVSHVIVGRDGTAAKVIAPDPRYFALQKLWLSEKPSRLATKRPKDFNQGNLVLDAVRDCMPQFPLDDGFYERLPKPLKKYFIAWSKGRAGRPVAKRERPRW